MVGVWLMMVMARAAPAAMPNAPEPAWHRRARRLGQSARAALRIAAHKRLLTEHHGSRAPTMPNGRLWVGCQNASCTASEGVRPGLVGLDRLKPGKR